MVTLIQLEYIIALDTHRHFVTAAEKCFVTQPTLSMQIKKLEEQMGVLIFDRSKQPVIPTVIGREIISQARITLDQSKKIKEIVGIYRDVVVGELKVGIISSLAPYLLPLFIGNMIKKHPDLKIKVIELMSEEIIEHLRKDLIDVGLLVTPVHENDVIEKPLFYEEIKVYTNNEHAFYLKKKINIEDIAVPDIWILGKGHCFRHQVINLCAVQSEEQANLPFSYESGSIETLKKLVDTNGGFTLLPQLAIDDMPMKKQRQVRSFSGIKPLREVGLVYVRSFAKQRLINILGESIKNAVPESMHEKGSGTIVEWR